jgi:prepilin-type N-terminal cleavage/methylation domain-containing protein
MVSTPERATDSSSFSARARACDGFTLIEILFVSGIIAVMSAIAVPTLLRSRAAANETSTIASMRVVHTAQLTFALTCGFGLYASNLPALAVPGEDFLPPDLTSSPTPTKSGYTYDMVPGPSGLAGANDCNGVPLAFDYYVTATPLTLGTTGNRAFASNQIHVIWQDTTGVPPAEPFTLGPTVSTIQ